MRDLHRWSTLQLVPGLSSLKTGTCCSSAARAKNGPRSGASSRSWTSPSPSVLIEVLIAEITLTDEEKTGFEFLVRGALGSLGLTGGTIPGLDVSTQGLSFTLDSSGETRALLDLFYKE